MQGEALEGADLHRRHRGEGRARGGADRAVQVSSCSTERLLAVLQRGGGDLAQQDRARCWSWVAQRDLHTHTAQVRCSTRAPGRGLLTPTPDGPGPDGPAIAQTADGNTRCLPLVFWDIYLSPIPVLQTEPANCKPEHPKAQTGRFPGQSPSEAIQPRWRTLARRHGLRSRASKPHPDRLSGINSSTQPLSPWSKACIFFLNLLMACKIHQ